jgi:hypothetical protein
VYTSCHSGVVSVVALLRSYVHAAQSCASLHGDCKRVLSTLTYSCCAIDAIPPCTKQVHTGVAALRQLQCQATAGTASSQAAAVTQQQLLVQWLLNRQRHLHDFTLCNVLLLVL